MNYESSIKILPFCCGDLSDSGVIASEVLIPLSRSKMFEDGDID